MTVRKTHSSAEKLAARFHGTELPALEEERPSAAEQQAARVRPPEPPARPAGMSTADWFASRYRPGEDDDNAA
ncbi:hypothetical protein [Streptomyces sp. ME19-01-6]|uniref:hypothetical protein n=1 Tax=Streptomyces sp. ME19-01-6 TaxID=3028686 RepID=UPI0029A76512|nr:hypothetical protein [Streptomyces sp. ME19-01-6]MDX3229415.1 hypothetical protein [Streptomyces sp. ME19-01-6]